MRIEEVEIESDNSSKADLLADDVLEEIRNRINFFSQISQPAVGGVLTGD